MKGGISGEQSIAENDFVKIIEIFKKIARICWFTQNKILSLKTYKKMGKKLHETAMALLEKLLQKEYSIHRKDLESSELEVVEELPMDSKAKYQL